jgi:hypothetical protein
MGSIFANSGIHATIGTRNMKRPVSHTLRVGDGPAVPVTQEPKSIAPEQGYMSLSRSVPAKK